MKGGSIRGRFDYFFHRQNSNRNVYIIVTYLVTMTLELPSYALRAYALFYSKYGSREPFSQSVLEWTTGTSMRKKIFSVLLRSGWIRKKDRNRYICVKPETAVKGLLDFKVPTIMEEAIKPYAFTGLSAIEIWSDFSYVQRGIERSPYFIKVLKKDLRYWKDFFNEHSVPNYVQEGSTIGEFVILIPVKRINSVDQEGLKVEPLKKTMKTAKGNEMYAYAYRYMRKKYEKIAA